MRLYKTIRNINKQYTKDKGKANIANYAFGTWFKILFFLMLFTIGLGVGYHYIVQSQAQGITKSFVINVEQYGVITTDMQKYYKSRYDKLKGYTGDYIIKYYKSHFNGNNFEDTVLGVSENGTSIGEVSVAKGDTIRIVFYSKKDDGLGRLLKFYKKDKDGEVKARVAVSSEGVVI